MKIIKFNILLMILISLTAAGCDRIVFISDYDKTPDDTITVTPVNDPQLAKMILKSNEKAIEIPRDPFKPIYSAPSSGISPKKVEPIRNTFSDIYFIGMIKMDDQAVALLKIGEKRVTLKLNDQYRGYIIKDIDNNHIVFSNGENQITLKRGAKK